MIHTPQEPPLRVYHLRDKQVGRVYNVREGERKRRFVQWACGFWQNYIPNRLIREQRA